MTPLAFFRQDEVLSLLERCARASATPLGLHFLERKEEGPRLAGWGSCEACRFVATHPKGHKACRLSRQHAAALALRQNRPIPFVCHLGFACLVARALPGEGFVLTLGPYWPTDEAGAIDADVAEGLAALGIEGCDEDTFTLEDLQQSPVAAISASMAWLLNDLRGLWEACQAEQAVVEAPEEDVAPATPRRGGRKAPSMFPGADVATALAGGDQPRARTLLKDAIAEVRAGKRVRIGLRRARTVAAVAAVLEAAEGGRLQTAEAWDAFPEFLATTRRAADTRGLLDAGMHLLGILKRREAGGVGRRPRARTTYTELDDILDSVFPESISLADIAARLGESPSALSHRLKRKFGMNYSEYVGRMRVNRAKDLLRRTKLSATEVAQRVGIRDQSNFGKLFKRLEGMSPLEYRERYGRKR